MANITLGYYYKSWRIKFARPPKHFYGNHICQQLVKQEQQSAVPYAHNLFCIHALRLIRVTKEEGQQGYSYSYSQANKKKRKNEHRRGKVQF